MNDGTLSEQNKISRRGFLAGGAAGCAMAGLSAGASAVHADETEGIIPPEDYRIERGHIRQSVMGWCFNPMPTETLIEACHRMGMPAMEGIDRKHYPRLRELGMVPGIVGSHGFRDGPLDPSNRDMCIQKLIEGINVAAEFGSKSVITFTGMRMKTVNDAQGARNCVEVWKEVMGHAEKKRVNVCLEHLNSRDGSHPMKGHPGYFGDDVDFCVELIKRVGSERMKLLFDIYHVQIMNGDVIRRLHQHKEFIGHIHTAGVPGRGELDETQELNYPPIMRAVLEIGFKGFVAQEFIPTWADKLGALRHGVRVCDV